VGTRAIELTGILGNTLLRGMQALLVKLGSWLGQKLAGAGLIVVLAVAGCGLWLYLRQEAQVETRRVETLKQAVAERDRLLAAQEAVEQRLAAIRTEIETQKDRAEKAAKVVEALRALESWWDRWFGNPQQQAVNAEQLRRMEALQREANGRAAELQRSTRPLLFERDALLQAVRLADEEIAGLATDGSKPRHYARAAWDDTKWYILAALGAYFFGPTLWAVSMYYGFAGLVAHGRPIQLGTEPPALPEVGASSVSLEAVLHPGEVLCVREKFLQTCDEGAGRHTRFVLDWRIPLTSVACGLSELIELRHPGHEGGCRATLSSSDDPHIELALVEVPAGASLVLRPSFLAAVIQRQGERLQIRRHWRLFRWQAWATGQFRFFEFAGPCRLVVAGSRGVRAERLSGEENAPVFARRTNQDATIGFTPNLQYRPVRAETFWSYYRGMNPLFDDLFAGRGLFVLQETSTDGPAGRAGRFWASVWNGVLKVFGL
jgi:hypothetical protein